MKKFITLLLIITTATFTYAFGVPARLTIGTSGNSSIRVVIDGQKYSNNNSNVFLFNNISTGYHTVKIFRQKKSFNKKPAFQVIYSDNVLIKAMYHTDITINAFGKVYVDEMLISKADYYQNDDWQDNDYGNWDNYNESMSSESFDLLKKAIGHEYFDRTKLPIAQQAIKSNYFTCAQVKELMSLFDFDENKLEIAKYAYSNTVDQGNYFILYDAFTFDRYKEELIKYLETAK